MKSFYGFVVVGAIGFLVHAAGVTTLMVVFDVSPIAAWVLAFLSAVSLTWILNRTFVFRSVQPTPKRTRGEYGRYILVQIAGAGISLGVFSTLLLLFPSLEESPIAAVAAGSALALCFNFAGAKWWVFAPADDNT